MLYCRRLDKGQTLLFGRNFYIYHITHVTIDTKMIIFILVLENNIFLSISGWSIQVRQSWSQLPASRPPSLPYTAGRHHNTTWRHPRTSYPHHNSSCRHHQTSWPHNHSWCLPPLRLSPDSSTVALTSWEVSKHPSSEHRPSFPTRGLVLLSVAPNQVQTIFLILNPLGRAVIVCVCPYNWRAVRYILCVLLNLSVFPVSMILNYLAA